MNANRLILLASAVALCACRDAKPTPTAVSTRPATPIQANLTGIVVASGLEITPVSLQTADGLIALTGPAALPMANVFGAQVSVRGAVDEYQALVVESFLVQIVQGLPALDGILESLADGFAIRLSDGTDYMLGAVPDELAAHVGARVWVTWAADNTIGFGVIQDAHQAR